MKHVNLESSRHAPIEVPASQFRAAGHALVDRIAELLSGMRERKVTTGLSASEIRKRLNSSASVPDEGREFGEVVAEAAELLIQHSLYNGHPKFLGYVTSSPAPIGMLAELLASAVNANVGAWTLSPAATEIELQTIRWIAELLGFPSDCSGVLVSGGNVANYVGIYAALRTAYPRSAATRRSEGLGRAAIYASTETHTWIEKVVDLLGLPTDALRSINVDGSQRMILEDLEERLRRDLQDGRVPIAIVGNAGTVSTGAIDPLPEIGRMCRERSIWFHVDGAYGGFATLAAGVPEEIHGLAQADSVAIDPHKWLYAPLEAGCALIRIADQHRAAFSYHPPYYHFGEEVTNFVDYGPQNSRGFRALKVWMALKQVGRRGYEQMILEDIALARDLHAQLAAHPEFEVFTCNLSITTFRYVPEEARNRTNDPVVQEYLNELNRTLQSRMEESGEVFISNAVVMGRYLLRSCIVNFRTSAKDISEIPGIIARHGRLVHQESKNEMPAPALKL
jgi:aromatic-L-amino-acid decarboxylase